MTSKIKRLAASATVALAIAGGAGAITVASATPAHAQAHTPGSLCFSIRQGEQVNRPCTFAEWWYLRYTQ